MKQIIRLSFVLYCVVFQFSAKGQYYNAAFGKNGAVLKTALHNIITGHTVLTYAALWSAYYTTDTKGGNIVWDIYSDIPGGTPPYSYTLGTNQCGTYSSEGDCYNREHTWPQYYFNSAVPMNSDLQHIFPTDGFVNGKRGNLPYGKVNTPIWTSDNGSKTGPTSSYPGYSGNVFEPIDSFKGDLARVYFYMSTRYEGEDAGWLNWEMSNGANLTTNAINLLMTWHHDDPVSAKEIERNNAVYALQGNRNPFIDYPVFADCIWGTGDCSSLAVHDIAGSNQVVVYPNPVHDRLQLRVEPSVHIIEAQVLSMNGMKLFTVNDMHQGIALNNLVPGQYLLLLITDKGILKKWVIKE